MKEEISKSDNKEKELRDVTRPSFHLNKTYWVHLKFYMKA